jgi:hypothetical protein
MSEISSIYDAVKARVAAKLTTHKLLPDPYTLESNPETFLEKGYSIAVKEAENSNRQIGCKISVRRNIEIAITRKFFTTDLNRDHLETREKDLLEDHALVIKDIEKDPSLATSESPMMVYVSDAGIQTVFDDKSNFIKIVSTFSVEYFESL